MEVMKCLKESTVLSWCVAARSPLNETTGSRSKRDNFLKFCQCSMQERVYSYNFHNMQQPGKIKTQLAQWGRLL